MTALQSTKLHANHQALGARMVDFGGWSMPVQYRGIIPEHQSVRQAAGIFDVSHMGLLKIEGPEAEAFLNYLVPNNIARLQDGKGLYTQLCRQDGGTLDDILVFRHSPHRYLMIVNAGNRQSDLDWVQRQREGFDCEINCLYDSHAILALQGPQAEVILNSLLKWELNLSDFPAFSIGEFAWQGQSLMVSRSGYTGEDGFEIYLPNDLVVELWEFLLANASPWGLAPIGLGARDTLRLEAGMPLYGHELSQEISPLEAGLAWSIKLDKPQDFIGKSALIAQKSAGLKQKRIGLVLKDTRRAPRDGYEILFQGEKVGQITSGSLSPTLDLPIGMGFVKMPYANSETLFEVQVRQQIFQAEQVKLPFYKRERHKQ